MAGSGVTLYSTTSAGNKTVIGTIDWREDTYMPSQINDNVGQIMADMRALANAIGTGWIEIGDGDGTYTATYVSATSFRFDGVDVTAYYRAGMRVRVVAPTPGTLSGTITSSVFSTHTTLVVEWDSGGLSNEAITSVSLGIGSGGGSGAAASYRNILGRNGGFEVWQRGAGGSAAIQATTGVYTADGWFFYPGVAGDYFVMQQAGTAPGSRYCCTIARSTGTTGVAAASIEFPLDADEIVPMRNNFVTLSFTASHGPGWSPAGKLLTVGFVTGTAAPSKTSGFAGAVYGIQTPQALTATAARYSFTSTVVVPANATQAAVYFLWTPTGTAGADDYFSSDDVQLEIGATATPFERRPFESELAACQRHYWKTFNYELAPAQNAGTASPFQFIAGKAGVESQFGQMMLPASMRVPPTCIAYNPGATNNQVRDASIPADCSSTSLGTASQSSIAVYTGGNASTAVGNLLAVHVTADAGI